MIGRLFRLLVLLAAIDIATGAVIDARLVTRPWAQCLALAQRPSGGEGKAAPWDKHAELT